jgi:hypothetical protein
MNEIYPPGLPGEHYLNVIKEGYVSAGFDAAVLERAVTASGMAENRKFRGNK